MCRAWAGRPRGEKGDPRRPQSTSCSSATLPVARQVVVPVEPLAACTIRLFVSSIQGGHGRRSLAVRAAREITHRRLETAGLLASNSRWEDCRVHDTPTSWRFTMVFAGADARGLRTAMPSSKCPSSAT